VNDILKQRLVGALILVALGVVFWPIIFVEPGEETVGGGRLIPARPAVNTEPITAPEKKSLRQAQALESRAQAERENAAREGAKRAQPEPTAKAEPAPAPAKKVAGAPPSRTRTKAPEKPVIDSEGVPIAWILQVASVSKPEKAEVLRTRLLELGYKAYVKKIKRSGNVLLRVYIGPKFERARLVHWE
jgi:DedD protein